MPKAIDCAVTADDFNAQGVLKALDKLHQVHVPRRAKRAPLWVHKGTDRDPGPWREVFEPDWNWQRADRRAHHRVLMDVNGAFLSPLSGTEVAHGALTHTGPLAAPLSGQLLPGYYRIAASRWGREADIVSPLGTRKVPPQVWVAHPTLGLLLDLVEEEVWPEVEILDSWTCAERVRMSDWAAWLKGVRLDAFEQDEEEAAAAGVELRPGTGPRATAVKDGYSMAVTMMRDQPEKGKASKSQIFRPDWHYAIRTQHRANMWRKAWRLHKIGVPILYLGKIDGIEIPERDLFALADMPTCPVKLDDTGRTLGAFKIREWIEADA
jgi:hypothetical protein